MKRSKIYYLIIFVLLLAFSIFMAFIIDEKMQISDDEAFTLYLVVKIAVSALVLLVSLYSLSSKHDPANNIIVNVASVVLLFLPLLLRVILAKEEPKLILGYVLSFVVVIAYLALVFGFDILNKKISQVAPTLEGKSISVESEENYYDKDGKFVSASKPRR